MRSSVRHRRNLPKSHPPARSAKTMQCNAKREGRYNKRSSCASPADRQPREVRHLHQAQLATAAEGRLDDLAPSERREVLLLEIAVRERLADVAEVPEPGGWRTMSEGRKRRAGGTHLTPFS